MTRKILGEKAELLKMNDKNTGEKKGLNCRLVTGEENKLENRPLLGTQNIAGRARK